VPWEDIKAVRVAVFCDGEPGLYLLLRRGASNAAPLGQLRCATLVKRERLIRLLNKAWHWDPHKVRDIINTERIWRNPVAEHRRGRRGSAPDCPAIGCPASRWHGGELRGLVPRSAADSRSRPLLMNWKLFAGLHQSHCPKYTSGGHGASPRARDRRRSK